MFGLIISSRPVDANPQAITPAQYAFKISPAASFSHIVLFLLPGAQFPPDTAATVYVQLPPSQDFKLLGGIGPGKESAIFKITGMKGGDAGGDIDLMTDDTSIDPAVTGDIVVGISIEPTAQVEAQLQTLRSQQQQQQQLAQSSTAMVRAGGPSTTDPRLTTKILAQRIIGNAFNFLASFGSETVPLKAFQGWWEKFEKKIELDPEFLEREQ